MKNIFLLGLLVTSTFACHIISKSEHPLAEQTTSTYDYVSPTVQVQEENMAALPPPLPADSIPVQYSVKGIANAPSDFIPMLGQWVSTFDEDESVHFTPGKYISYYKGEKVVEEHMVYYRVCPDNCGSNGNKACFVLASDYGQNCFSIVSHTDQRLELSLLGSGNDNVLTYVRK